MNHEEINNLVLQYQKEKSQDKRDEIFDIIYKSQYSMIMQHTMSYRDEDLMQEIMLAFVECLKNYNPKYNTNFNTYLFYYIQRGKNNYQNKRFVIRQHSKTKLPWIEITSLDINVHGKITNFYYIDEWMDLQKKLDLLSDEDKDILKMSMEGYTLIEIGDKYGRSPEGIRHILLKLRKTLK